MDKKAQLSEIIGCFPELATDPDFDITSPKNPDYNCIAWAANYSDRWMQPPNGSKLPYTDGVSYWPDGVTCGMSKECLIEVFKRKGYVECSSWMHEDGFQKVALYCIDNMWTHAARELVTKPNIGKWTSKLGGSNDIRHGTPFSIEGSIYGKVYCIMKREFR